MYHVYKETDHPEIPEGCIATVAQMVERNPEEVGVSGSIPFGGTKFFEKA